MFIEELKQIYTNFTAAANQLLSGLFNDGVLILEEKMHLIMVGICFSLKAVLNIWMLNSWHMINNAKIKKLNKKFKRKNKTTDVLTFVSPLKFYGLEKNKYCDIFFSAETIEIDSATNYRCINTGCWWQLLGGYINILEGDYFLEG